MSQRRGPRPWGLRWVPATAATVTTAAAVAAAAWWWWRQQQQQQHDPEQDGDNDSEREKKVRPTAASTISRLASSHAPMRSRAGGRGGTMPSSSGGITVMTTWPGLARSGGL